MCAAALTVTVGEAGTVALMAIDAAATGMGVAAPTAPTGGVALAVLPLFCILPVREIDPRRWQAAWIRSP